MGDCPVTELLEILLTREGIQSGHEKCVLESINLLNAANIDMFDRDRDGNRVGVVKEVPERIGVLIERENAALRLARGAERSARDIAIELKRSKQVFSVAADLIEVAYQNSKVTPGAEDIVKGLEPFVKEYFPQLFEAEE